MLRRGYGRMTERTDRLDSWKAIAEYLNRDIRTLRRWEQQGLPIQRVPGGRGHSVFAYRSEIDAWMTSAGEKATPADQATPPPGLAAPAVATEPLESAALASSVRPASRPIHWRLVAAVVVVVGGLLIWRVRAPSAAEESLVISADSTGIVATNQSGRSQWRYDFPAGQLTELPDIFPQFLQLGGERPGVFVASSYSSRRGDGMPSSGVLHWFSPSGRLLRTFSFADRWTFGDARTFAEPWAITDVRATEAGGPWRIAVAAHHYEWWPSVVTVLGPNWERQGTFVNSGWVDSVHWLTPERLAISGFNQAHDGGMAALLDARALDGTSPEAPGSPFACQDCRAGRPLVYFVFPRSELNRVTGSGFNRAMLSVSRDRVFARVDEVDHPHFAPAMDAIYEFSPSLEFLGANYSDRYWDRHRALELEGKLHHTRENCPERNGPLTVLAWDRERGWRTINTQTPRR